MGSTTSGPQVRSHTLFFLNYLTDGQGDALLEWTAGFNMQHKLEFGHLCLAFGTRSCVDSLSKLGDMSLESLGEEPICARVECPVLLTSARDSIYTVEPHLIYEKLVAFSGGQEGLTLWDPVGAGRSSLQAKCTAVSQ